MTPRRPRSRHAHRTILAALAVALSASFALTTAGIAHAGVPAHLGGHQLPSPLAGGREQDAESDPTPLATGGEQALAAASTYAGTFTSLDPARILDTRVGNGAPQQTVAANATVNLQVTGRGGVPVADVAAVVVNVTVTGPTAGGFITVYPAGGSQPTASNLNFAAGQTIPNLVTVKIGADGTINLTNNSAGRVHLIADVAGYYLAGTPEVAGAFVSLDPARILDTRIGNGAPQAAVTAGGIVKLQVTGRGGVPAGDIGAVVVNVTVTNPTTGGFITVHPSDYGQPNSSNLNFAAGQSIPNLVTVMVSADGKLNLVNNSAGTVHLIADVAGYYLAGTANVPGAFVPLAPGRILDTRVGTSAAEAPVEPNGSVGLQVTEQAFIPGVDVAAVVLNVTATVPETGGFVTVYPYGNSMPTASNLNFTAGQNIPNLVMVKVGGNGKISLTNNSAGTVHLIADAFGYFRGVWEELDEVWPEGWVFDDCEAEWDGLLLQITPGIVFSPQGEVYKYEGQYYYEYLPDGEGRVIVTVSAKQGYVLLPDPDVFISNGDGTYTGTFQFTDDPC